MLTQSPNTTLIISSNQQHVLAMYSHHLAEYRMYEKAIIQCSKKY